MFLVVLAGMLLVFLVVFIFFFLTLSKALSRCHWRNRTMEPGQVWLNFIPLFHLVWQFITVNRVADSLRNEFYDRGWHRRDEDYGRGLGIAACALWIVAGLPYIGLLFGIGGSSASSFTGSRSQPLAASWRRAALMTSTKTSTRTTRTTSIGPNATGEWSTAKNRNNRGAANTTMDTKTARGNVVDRVNGSKRRSRAEIVNASLASAVS